MDKNVQEALRKRYEKVHPLIWYRSVEYAKTNGELFDIMESLPEGRPIKWDAKKGSWVETKLLQQEVFDRKKE